MSPHVPLLGPHAGLDIGLAMLDSEVMAHNFTFHDPDFGNPDPIHTVATPATSGWDVVLAHQIIGGASYPFTE